MRYKPSYYNLCVDYGSEKLLYNGVSSALIKLPESLFIPMSAFLGETRRRDAGTGLDDWEFPVFERDEVPSILDDYFDEFLEGNFFVQADEHEQTELKNRYEFYQENSPFLVTITTTMDCNLGCYYCYEEHENQYLSVEGCDKILDWIQNKIEKEKHSRLYIDWYGGEPMLNKKCIDYFSSKAIAYCDSRGIAYKGSMISNGTVWPEDAAEFAQRNRIQHVQITLDGPKIEHNKRRRYLDTESNPNGSYDQILETVDKLVGKIKVYLRINVDPWLGEKSLELIDVFEDRGWLGPNKDFYPYLASIGPMTNSCGFLGESKDVQDFQVEFHKLKHEFRARVGKFVGNHGAEALQYYPRTVHINCAAVGKNSVIFTPDGSMYKCGLEVGDKGLSHDRIDLTADVKQDSKNSLPIVDMSKISVPADRWEKYDPFSHERCGKCQFLPICMGGCPKTHFEKNEYYLNLQSQYWEENFDDVIRNYYEMSNNSIVQHADV